MKFRLSKGDGNGLEFNVRNFHLEVRTSALNSTHDAWTRFCGRSDEEKWATKIMKVWLRLFYSVGIVCGIVGFLVGIGVLVFSCKSFLLETLLHPSNVQEIALAKRSMDPPVVVQKSHFAISAIVCVLGIVILLVG